MRSLRKIVTVIEKIVASRAISAFEHLVWRESGRDSACERDAVRWQDAEEA